MVKTTFKKYARKNLRAYKKRKTTKKTGQVATIRKVVKSMILKKAEPKEKTTNFGLTQLYHNVGYYKKFNDTTDMPSQGLTDETRIGDQINVGGFYMRLLCGQKSDRPNITWKFYIFKIPKGATINYNTLFNSVTNNILLDNPNKDLVTVLKAFTLKPSQSTFFASGVAGVASQKEYTFPVKIWLPYKKVYKFQSNNGVTHNDHDLMLVVFAYDAYGSLLTDNVAYIEHVSTMYYKDP